MPIFVYRCDGGHRFERLVPRDAEAPPCPDCGGATRKIPAGPSIGRRTAGAPAAPASGSVPIPWRGVVSGGAEKMRREVEFRQRLEAKAVGGLRLPGGPERQSPPSGDGGSSTPPPAATS